MFRTLDWGSIGEELDSLKESSSLQNIVLN
jgi:hypothetical protein